MEDGDSPSEELIICVPEDAEDGDGPGKDLSTVYLRMRKMLMVYVKS
jgi:hypothetical protein